MQITFTVSVDDTERMARVLAALGVPVVPAEGGVFPEPEAKPEKAPEPAAKPPKAKRKRRTKAQMAADKAAEEAAAAPAKAAEVVDEDPMAQNVSLDDLKGAVRSCIEATSIENVKAIFAEHGAAKISDLDPAVFGDVYLRLTKGK